MTGFLAVSHKIRYRNCSRCFDIVSIPSFSHVYFFILPCALLCVISGYTKGTDTCSTSCCLNLWYAYQYWYTSNCWLKGGLNNNPKYKKRIKTEKNTRTTLATKLFWYGQYAVYPTLRSDRLPGTHSVENVGTLSIKQELGTVNFAKRTNKPKCSKHKCNLFTFIKQKIFSELECWRVVAFLTAKFDTV